MSERAKATVKAPAEKTEKAAARIRQPECISSAPSPYEHIIQLQRIFGNLVVQRLFESGHIQAKLKIGAPNDVYEQEADRVADRVMRMSEREGEGRRVKGNGTPSPISDLEPLSAAKRGWGSSLPDSEQTFFGSRFGYDFSGVRVHTNSQAGALANSIQAKAFTVGRDIFFGKGEYSPATTAGKQLLAHELTHVVQQAGQPLHQGVQRKLLVNGKPADINVFINLLEPASGFTLRHDSKTGEVSISASRLKPPSFVLAGRLATIIDDPTQDAELALGRRQPGVGFGAFPFSGPLVQQIDIDDMERLESRAPGSGVAFLIHEIVENYKAHEPSMQQFDRGVVFGALHEEALEAERLVAEELGGLPGGRVAAAMGMIGRDIVRRVDDYENYFLVIDHQGDVLTAARRVDRVNVSRYTIRGFANGSATVPSAERSTIAAVVDDLVANPFATVLVKSGDVDPALAGQRAEEVRDSILAAGKGRQGFDLRSERNFNLIGFGLIDIGQAGTSGFAIVTVEKPDTDAEAERGRLVKKVLPVARRR